MSQREKIVQFIRTGPHSVDEWINFQQTLSILKLKTVSKDKVLISVDGSGFEDPMVWLSNFEINAINNVKTGISRLKRVVPNEKFNEVISSLNLGPRRSSFNEELAELLTPKKAQDVTENASILAVKITCRCYGMDPDSFVEHMYDVVTKIRNLS